MKRESSATREADKVPEPRQTPENEQPQPTSHSDAPEEHPAKKADPTKELTNQLQRLQAEFDNYRKRVEQEATDAKERGKVEAVKELLPVIDALELALTHANTPEGKDALAQGVATIHSQLKQILERLGVHAIATEGMVDPRHHEVYLTETSDKHPANSIIQTLQKGYTRNGTILRTAKVKAARAQ
jgi:molecular chaperone GrpE